jgi:hypothetical protein
MSETLPIEEMTLQQKLELLDRLCDDLARQADLVPSPAWHEEVVEARLAEIEAGRGRFVPLDDAARRLRNRHDIDEVLAPMGPEVER